MNDDLKQVHDDALVALFSDILVLGWMPNLASDGTSTAKPRPGRTTERITAVEAARRLTAALPRDGRALASDAPETLRAAVACDDFKIGRRVRQLRFPIVSDEHGWAIVTPSLVLAGYREDVGMIPVKRTEPGDEGRSMTELLSTSPDDHVSPRGEVGICRPTDGRAEEVRAFVAAAMLLEGGKRADEGVRVVLGVDEAGFEAEGFAELEWQGGMLPLATAVVRALRPVGYRWEYVSPFVNRRRSAKMRPTRFVVEPATRPASATLRAVGPRQAERVLRTLAERTDSRDLSAAIDAAVRARGGKAR